MQQSYWKVSHGRGCADAGPFALFYWGDFSVVQDVSQRSLARRESPRQLYQRVIPNLRPEWRYLALTEQTKVEARRQADDQVAIVAPAKRAQV